MHLDFGADGESSHNMFTFTHKLHTAVDPGADGGVSAEADPAAGFRNRGTEEAAQAGRMG